MLARAESIVTALCGRGLLAWIAANPGLSVSVMALAVRHIACAARHSTERLFMYLFKYAKSAVLMFWLLAAFNMLLPLAEPWAQRLNWLAAIILLVHVAEVLLFNRRLQAQSAPWLARVQVLLFGFFHLRTLR